MKHETTIPKELLVVALDYQSGIMPILKYMDLSGESVTIDKDYLLTTVCNKLGYDIDWEYKTVTTNKGYYNNEEFMIKFTHNGRQILRGLEPDKRL